MQIKARVVQMFEGMKIQARAGAEEAFKQKIPNATPAQLKKVDAIADEMFDNWPVDEMVDAMVPIYQKHLTKSDLDAIIVFYSSPAGQKFIRESGPMTSEAMKVGGEFGRARINDVNQRMEDKISDLIREIQQEQTKSSSPK
jgi:hypothetical protein